MPNPLTLDPEEAEGEIRRQRNGGDPEPSLAEKQEAVRDWLETYGEAVEDGDTREMTRMLGWLDEVTEMAREVESHLEDGDA